MTRKHFFATSQKMVLGSFATVLLMAVFSVITIGPKVWAGSRGGYGTGEGPQDPSAPIVCYSGANGSGNPSNISAVKPLWRSRLAEAVRQCRGGGGGGWYAFDQSYIAIDNRITIPLYHYKSSSYDPPSHIPVYGTNAYHIYWYYVTKGSHSETKIWDLWIRDFDCDGKVHSCDELTERKGDPEHYTFESAGGYFQYICKQECEYFEDNVNIPCSSIIGQAGTGIEANPADLFKQKLAFDTSGGDELLSDANQYIESINVILMAMGLEDSLIDAVNGDNYKTVSQQANNLAQKIAAQRQTFTGEVSSYENMITSQQSNISSIEYNRSTTSFSLQNHCSYSASTCYDSGSSGFYCYYAKIYRDQLSTARSRYYALLNDLDTDDDDLRDAKNSANYYAGLVDTYMSRCKSRTCSSSYNPSASFPSSSFCQNTACACNQSYNSGYSSIYGYDSDLDSARSKMQELQEKLNEAKRNLAAFDGGNQEIVDQTRNLQDKLTAYEISRNNAGKDWRAYICPDGASANSSHGCMVVNMMENYCMGKTERMINRSVERGWVNVVTRGSISGSHYSGRSGRDTQHDIIVTSGCSMKACYKTIPVCHRINSLYVEEDESCPNGKDRGVFSVYDPETRDWRRCRQCNAFSSCEEAAELGWMYDSSYRDDDVNDIAAQTQHWVDTGLYNKDVDTSYWTIKTDCEADDSDVIKKWITPSLQCTVACPKNCANIRDPDTDQFMEEVDKPGRMSSCASMGYDPIIKEVDAGYGLTKKCIASCAEPCKNNDPSYFSAADTKCDNPETDLPDSSKKWIQNWYRRNGWGAPYGRNVRCYTEKCQLDCDQICRNNGLQPYNYDCTGQGTGYPVFTQVTTTKGVCSCVSSCNGDACRSQGYYPLSHASVCIANGEQPMETESVVDNQGNVIQCLRGCKATTPSVCTRTSPAGCTDKTCAAGVAIANEDGSVTLNGSTLTTYTGDLYVNNTEVYYNERNAWLVYRAQRYLDPYYARKADGSGTESDERRVTIAHLGYEKKEKTDSYQICRWDECRPNNAEELAAEYDARFNCPYENVYYHALDNKCRYSYRYRDICFANPPANNCHTTACGNTECRCGPQYTTYSCGSDDNDTCCRQVSCTQCKPICYVETDLGYGVYEVPCVGPGGERTHNDFCTSTVYNSYEACKVPVCNQSLHPKEILDDYDRTNFKKCGFESVSDSVVNLDQDHELVDTNTPASAYGIGGVYQCSHHEAQYPDAGKDGCNYGYHYCFHVLACNESTDAAGNTIIDETYGDEFDGELTDDDKIFIPETATYKVGQAGRRCGRYWEVSKSTWTLAGVSSNLYSKLNLSPEMAASLSDQCSDRSYVTLNEDSFTLNETKMDYSYFQNVIDIPKLPECINHTFTSQELARNDGFYICRIKSGGLISDLAINNPTLLRADTNLVVFMDEEDGVMVVDTQVETAENYFKAFISRDRMIIASGVGTLPEAAYKDNTGCRTVDTADLQGVFVAKSIEFPHNNRADGDTYAIDDPYTPGSVVNNYQLVGDHTLVGDSQMNAFNKELYCDRQLAVAGTLMQWGEGNNLKLTRTFRGCVGGNEDVAAKIRVETDPSLYIDYNKIMSAYVFYQRPDFQRSAPEWLKTSHQERIETN